MSSPTPKRRILILGAGVTGLSSAYHLTRFDEFDVTVLEKTDRVGGLAASFQLGPATFDFGPHAFHSQEPRLIEFFQTLMAGQFREIEKDVAIQFNGKLYPYPLNPVRALRDLPLSVSVRCGLSYLWNALTNLRSLDNLRTSEEFFVRNFGWELYRIFFEGYTHKVWGIHPRELSAAFIKNRLPSASLMRIAWAALTGRDIKTRKPHEVPLKLRIFYPTRGSIQFPETMKTHTEQKGGRFLFQAEVEAVELSENRAVAVRFIQNGRKERLECDHVISSIPLNDLVRRLDPPAKPETLGSCGHLSFRPILIACLWINKPALFSQQTIYYTNRIFNRLAQMNSYSPDVIPSGTCGVTAELTCEAGDNLWTMPEKELIAKIVEDIQAEGLMSREDLRDGMILRNRHGYPIYRVGFEEHLKRLRQTVHDISNVYAAGREGMFNYAQMHYGVKAGMLLADHLHQGRTKPTLPVEDTEDVYFA